MPDINDNTVQYQLANLKASGEHARIIGEVQEQIEQKAANERQKEAGREYGRGQPKKVSKPFTKLSDTNGNKALARRGCGRMVRIASGLLFFRESIHPTSRPMRGQ